MPTTPDSPNSPNQTATEVVMNNVSLSTTNAAGQDGQVTNLNDTSGASPALIGGGNRGRGRGGRGGRTRGSGRGRRSTSGPPPELDHSIEVLCYKVICYEKVNCIQWLSEMME